jgi:2-oxoglutarate ferredoxin oxidoreductase subunit alpha
MTIPAQRSGPLIAEADNGRRRETKELSDLAVMIGGQGGDGTLTVSDLLGRYFRRRALYVYTVRNVLSRIRGGHADSSIRASRSPIAAMKAEVDLLVAFDQEAIQYGLAELERDGLVLYDSSTFKSDLPNAVGFPFAQMVGGQVGQPIYKNTAAFGAISVMMGFDPALTRNVIEDRFKRRSAEALEKNLKALEIGRQAALGRPDLVDRWSVVEGDAPSSILLTGNQAVALGFVVGGGRFFAGYPITPATEIMEYVGRYLPAFHGVMRQAEDELAAINMIIGASYAGARVMTATSGPGLSLMAEGIGQSGAAEVPVVVVDSQRVGPSTGEPTRHEQSDLSHVVHMGHGEYPRFVLAPGTAEDCFGMTIDALTLADKWRLPVIILLDQALSQNSVTTAPFDLSPVRIDRGKLLTPEELAKQPAYYAYTLTPDGISPRVPPGTPGVTTQITGNEHDEQGHVSVNPGNRDRMMRKRMGKLQQARADLPAPNLYGEAKAKIGFIGFGSTWGPIREAQELLGQQGIASRFYQARTLFPVPVDSLAPFLDSVETAYVVEHNFTGQLAALLRETLPQYHAKLRSVLKYDGNSFRARDIVRRVQER